MRMRRPTVSITDHRPAISGLEHLSRSQARNQREHDQAVAGYDEHLCLAVAEDLGKRQAWNRADHEQRWVMGRKAAVLRKLDREGAFR